MAFELAAADVAWTPGFSVAFVGAAEADRHLSSSKSLALLVAFAVVAVAADDAVGAVGVDVGVAATLMASAVAAAEYSPC